MVKQEEQEQEQDLSDLIEGSLNPDSGTKKAIETLHPDNIDKLDKLTNLDDQEISAHSGVEWQIKAMETPDWTKTFIIRGFTDKIKALKISKQGTGRNEITTIFKPEILGEMFQQGMVPDGMGMQQQRRGFLSRMFGRR